MPPAVVGRPRAGARAARRRRCPEGARCRFFGALDGLCEGGVPRTVGELRAVLREHSLPEAPREAVPTGAPGAPAGARPLEVICVGGRQLPADDAVELGSLLLDPRGEVGVCPPIAGGGECCPPAAKRGEEAELGVGERFLSLWLLLAMGLGIGLGQVPFTDRFIAFFELGRTNLLTAGGMILMLLPPFASVKYNELLQNLRRLPKRIGLASIVTNWLVGPLVMLSLGVYVLRDQGEILQGVLYIGAARCIAMVLIWNGFAGGDQLVCISLVLLNSIITIIAYAPVVSALGSIASWLGVDLVGSVGFGMVLQNVLLYLAVPLLLGFGLWLLGHGYPGYDAIILPGLSQAGLLALLWTVMWMFASMSEPLLAGRFPIAEVCLALVPLLLYFAVMFALTWIFARYAMKLGKEQTITLAFTAASNNFELALAATASIYGPSSVQAVTTLMGPISEIPVMLLMVKVAKHLP